MKNYKPKMSSERTAIERQIQATDNQIDQLVYQLYGLTEEEIKIDLWLKDIAPSNELRKWFNHDPAKWNSFKEKYKNELKEKKDLVELIRKLEKEKGTITLLYSAKDEKHNNAVALTELVHLL